MRGGSVVATNITKEYGATVVLDRLSLTVPPGARVGVVGPNGSGKSTLLRVLAGADEPSTGRVDRVGTVGYLPQETERRHGDTLLGHLARRAGVADAEARMERGDVDGVDEFLTLGGADLAARARKVCAQLGIAAPLDTELPTLSGGEAARVSLAALLLSRFNVLCLDEPTNDLDFDGLERLERFVGGLRGSLVVVSHDRAFLDRAVTRIVEVDEWTAGLVEVAGGWSDYEVAREQARAAQHRRFEETQERRRELEALVRERQANAQGGAALGKR